MIGKIYQQERASLRRKGIVAVLAAFLFVMVFAFVALTVDISYITLTKSRLQNAADGAVMAAVLEMNENVDYPDSVIRTNAETAAADISSRILSEDGNVLSNEDIEFGDWDSAARIFSPSAATTSVRVTVRRATNNGNPLTLFFAPFLGRETTDVSASAVATLHPVGTADVIPMALRAPGFGVIDPKISDVNPGKDGPSSPANGEYFKIGEQVTIFIYGKGKKSPVHLTLEVDIPGPGAPEADVKKILRGEEPPVPVSLDDEFPVFNEGSGSGGYGSALDDRINTPFNSPLRDVIVPVVDVTPASRNEDQQISGPVKVVDFVAVHLDDKIAAWVEDPDKPGETIEIEILVGTIIRTAVSGSTAGNAATQSNISVVGLKLVQ